MSGRRGSGGASDRGEAKSEWPVGESEAEFDELVYWTEKVVNEDRWTSFAKQPISKRPLGDFPVFWRTWVQPIALEFREDRTGYQNPVAAYPSEVLLFGSGKKSWTYALSGARINRQRLDELPEWRRLPRSYRRALERAHYRAPSAEVLPPATTTTATVAPKVERRPLTPLRGGGGGRISARSGERKRESERALAEDADLLARKDAEIGLLRAEVDDLLTRTATETRRRQQVEAERDAGDRRRADEIAAMKSVVTRLTEENADALARTRDCGARVDESERDARLLRDDLSRVQAALSDCRSTCGTGGGGTKRRESGGRVSGGGGGGGGEQKSAPTVAPVSAGRHDALVLDPTSRLLEGILVTDPETGNERLRVLDRPVTLSFAGRMYDPILTDTVNNGAPFEAPPLTPPRSGGGGGGAPSRRATLNRSNGTSVPPPPDIELKRLRSVPVNASILGEIQRIRELQTDSDRALRPSQLFPNRRRPLAPSATAATGGGGGGGRVGGGGGGSSVVGLDDLMRGLAHNLQLRRIAIDNAADRIVEEEDAWSDEDERELDDAEVQRRETERARAKIREQLRK